ncbi:MAG: methyltransferase domain-containing protein [Planctomycetota bacterium]|nr:methyltransferase domain-containing protein [Planctomycetota bacterium]
MLELRCTVRNCDQSLILSEAGLGCGAGHHFDQAKEGYWNLTQPQDKKSTNPGDNRDAVMARHRWLRRGHTAGLVTELKDWVASCSSDSSSAMRALDLGCGDGSFGPLMFPGHATGFCGIDLSRSAIKLAAKHWPEATWVLANADRGLPVMDSSVDCVVSLFGRRPIAEIKRVLTQAGTCIVAVPAEDDLIELREAVQKRGVRRSRVDAIVEEMQDHGLACVGQKQWRTRVEIGTDEIEEALAMTYRARRWSEKSRISSLDKTEVTLSADLMRFRKD